MAEDERPRLQVPEEQVFPLGGNFKLDYRLLWLVAVASGDVILIAFCWLALGSAALGFILAILAFIAVAVLIGPKPFEDARTTVMALAFRKVNHRLLKRMGYTQHQSVGAMEGETFGSLPDKKPAAPSFRILGRVEIYPFDVAEEGAESPRPLGVVRDRKYQTYSATMWSAGSSLLSATDEAQMEKVRGFAHVLDGLAGLGSPLHRLAWREQTLLGEQLDPEALLAGIRKRAQLTRVSPPNEDVFKERLGAMGGTGTVHRTTMTLSVHGPSIRRLAKLMGSPEVVLVQQLEAFYAAMVQSGPSALGLRAATFLTYNELVLENRLLLDPVFGQGLWASWSGPPQGYHSLSQNNAWPDSADFNATDMCRVGQTWHMGFYVSQFTRTGMLPDQMWYILRPRVPKTVTTVIQMIPGSQAAQRAEWATNAAHSTNSELLAKRRRVTEAQLIFADDARAHEREIAQSRGHVGRIRCYIDVTGATPAEVKENARQEIESANQGRFHLEPLTGRQATGIEALLPATRGLAAFGVPKVLRTV